MSRLPLRALLLTPVAVLIAAAPVTAQVSNDDVVVNSTQHAGAGLTTKSVPVAVRDLNLADGSGYARLNRRLADAADKVCAKDGVWSSFDNIAEARCRHQAIATAMTQVVGHASVAAGVN